MNFQPTSFIIIMSTLVVSLLASPWSDWHDNPVSGFIIPTVPITSLGYTYQRYYPTNAATVFANYRYTQYQWDLFYTGNTTSQCTFYCGPKSFLTNDPSNSNIVCKRDMNYWANIQNDESYKQYCIPKTSNCGATSQIGELITGSCSVGSYVGTYADTDYDCCYNEDLTVYQNSQELDEVTFLVTNTPNSLRLAQ